MKPVEKIHTLELFPPLSRELQSLLKSLSADDWQMPTVCLPWSVKDVAAHLLGGSLGRLWRHADAASSPLKPKLAYHELVALIDQENERWVRAARRISPEILIDLLDLTDRRLYLHFKSLDEDRPARAEVAWAGQSISPNWFDIAREYTEKWLHQQHIRQAVGQPLLIGRKWLFPVLDTFIRAFPHTYRAVGAEDGTAISVHIAGEAGGDWSILRLQGEWQLFSGLYPGAVSVIRMDQELAWRLFTRGVHSETARSRVQIEGDKELGLTILEMVSIMV